MCSSLCVIFALVIQTVESDRQPVAATKFSAADVSYNRSQAPGSGQALIKKAIDGAKSIGDALSQVESLGAVSDKTRAAAPAALVWVRLSKRYVANHVEHAVDRTKPVRDLILGTTIDGESRTTGNTHLVLYPNDHGVVGDVEFVGEVHAKTVGHNGPATLQYLADSTFRAHKRILIGETGLHALPAVADAPTHLTATSIQMSRGGLLGRIGQRIAWRRVTNSQSEADAIVSDHTARDIRHDMDRKINESVAAMQSKLQAQIASLKLDSDGKELLVRSRSTPDCIEVALCRCGASEVEPRIPSFVVQGNPDIAVRVHRTLLARALTDPELRDKFAPILGSVAKNSLAATRNVLVSSQTGLTPSNWSLGGDWLALDFTAAAKDDASPRVAAEEKLDGQRIK